MRLIDLPQLGHKGANLGPFPSITVRSQLCDVLAVTAITIGNNLVLGESEVGARTADVCRHEQTASRN